VQTAKPGFGAGDITGCTLGIASSDAARNEQVAVHLTPGLAKVGFQMFLKLKIWKSLTCRFLNFHNFSLKLFFKLV